MAEAPFQVTPGHFVIPYHTPPETYRLTIGNGRHRRQGQGYDPLTGANVAAKVVSRSSDRLVVEMPVTDSPRLLTVRET